jgi:hypothetical protein
MAGRLMIWRHDRPLLIWCGIRRLCINSTPINVIPLPRQAVNRSVLTLAIFMVLEGIAPSLTSAIEAIRQRRR